MTPWLNLSNMSTELRKVARKRKRDLDLQDRRAELGGALALLGGASVPPGVSAALTNKYLTSAEAASNPELTKRMIGRSGHKAFSDPTSLSFDAHAMPKGFMPKIVRKHVEEVVKREKDPLSAAKARGVLKQLEEGVYLKGRAAHAPTIAAHELGHMDIGMSRAGRLLQNMPTAMALRLTPAAGLASGIVSGIRSGEEDESAARRSMIVPAVTAVPGMGYEGLAHVKGIKHLRGAGMKPGQIAKQMLRSNLPAYLTYATLPATGAALAYGGTKSLQALRRRRSRDSS